MVYVAADRALPLIPWDESNPGFHVRELHETQQCVSVQFRKPRIYALGSYQGCGCGFRPQPWTRADDRLIWDKEIPAEIRQSWRDDHQQRQADRRRLGQYLADAGEAGDVELYVCWAGDEQTEPAKTFMMTPEEVREAMDTPAFDFRTVDSGTSVFLSISSRYVAPGSP